MKLTGTAKHASRHLKARASITPTNGENGWTLSLATELDGVTGERSLSGSSCESLSDAAAVMLALILNPDLVVPSAGTNPAPPEALPVETSPAAGDSPKARWTVGVYGGAQLGAVEELSAALALSFQVTVGHLSLRVMPSFTLPQDIFIDGDGTLGGRLWLASGAALGCWSQTISFLNLSPCLGVDITRLHGRGLGVLHSDEASVYWTSADLGVFVGVPVGYGVSFELVGLGAMPLHRPTVYLDDIGAISRPATVGLKALGGISWLFY